MTEKRATGPSLRCDLPRGQQLHLTLDGQPLEAFEGETIAAALLGNGVRTLRRTTRRNEPRGAFCAMGVCFDCLVTVDGRPNVQACLTPVVDGMQVETQEGPGQWATPS